MDPFLPAAMVGENVTFMGGEKHACLRGVAVEVLQNEDCLRLRSAFIVAKPELRNEDIRH